MIWWAPTLVDVRSHVPPDLRDHGNKSCSLVHWAMMSLWSEARLAFFSAHTGLISASFKSWVSENGQKSLSIIVHVKLQLLGITSWQTEMLWSCMSHLWVVSSVHTGAGLVQPGWWHCGQSIWVLLCCQNVSFSFVLFPARHMIFPKWGNWAKKALKRVSAFTGSVPACRKLF